MFEAIIEQISKAHEEIKISVQDFVITIETTHDNFKEILSYLKNDSNLEFSILTDLTAVDYPDRAERFELVYNLLSIINNARILLKFPINDGQEVETIADLYSAAIWYERETWDMYGISFAKNPDLRRILTDYEFEGYPLRKDFPLTGYKEVRYDEVQQKVIYEPVVLQQDYRNFNFLSPWEGTNYILPGDEKAEKKS